MARPRKHDIVEVRQAAMKCFWENGFSNSSMALLQEATGIDKKQLARDFGSKSGLFVEVLADFFQILRTQQLFQLEAATATLADIRRVLRSMASRIEEPEGKFGCMICNTALDQLAMSDPNVAKLVNSYFEFIEKAYRKALFSARKRMGLYLKDEDLVRLGRSLMASQVAVMLLLRSGVTKEVLDDIVEQALAPLLQLEF